MAPVPPGKESPIITKEAYENAKGILDSFGSTGAISDVQIKAAVEAKKTLDIFVEQQKKFANPMLESVVKTAADGIKMVGEIQKSAPKAFENALAGDLDALGKTAKETMKDLSTLGKDVMAELNKLGGKLLEMNGTVVQNSKTSSAPAISVATSPVKSTESTR